MATLGLYQAGHTKLAKAELYETGHDWTMQKWPEFSHTKIGKVGLYKAGHFWIFQS